MSPVSVRLALVASLVWGAALPFGVLAQPAFQTSPDLGPGDVVALEAGAAWASCQAFYRVAAGPVPEGTLRAVTVRRALRLARGLAGESLPGEIWLRQAHPFVLSQAERLALRHEVIHQFLFGVCPKATGDTLFHEVFALALSGELPLWSAERRHTIAWAVQILEQPGVRPDMRVTRQALARLVLGLEQPRLDGVLVGMLAQCASPAPWKALTVAALVP